jgi:hypothetical protein
MSANRHRYSQAFPLAYTFACLVVAVCVGGFCVRMLFVKHQITQSGERLKRLAGQLAEINIKNEALQTRKDQLTSTPALQKAIKDGFIRLVKIEDRFVLHVGASRRGVAATSPQAAPGGAR